MANENELQKTEARQKGSIERTRAGKTFTPRTDIIEQENSILVIADMPGVDEKSVDINVEKHVLTITGKVEPEDFGNHRLAYHEYEVGDYQRQFTLSDQIDVDGIEAGISNGVLRLELPKSEAVKPRKIEVKAG